MTIKVIAPSSVEDNLGSGEVLGLLSDSITVHHTPHETYYRMTLSYYRVTHLLLSHQQIYSVSTPFKIPLRQQYSSTPPKTKT